MGSIRSSFGNKGGADQNVVAFNGELVPREVIDSVLNPGVNVFQPVFYRLVGEAIH